MSIDLSGPLLSLLEKKKKEYENALNSKNITLAREKAMECARISRRLAEEIPSYKDVYLEKASEWENIAKNIDSKVYESKAGKSEDEYRDYIYSLISKSKVKWSDIGGLEEVKRLIMENIIISIIEGGELVKPWRGILLFGPPGTGKTMIAAACAGELNATFFNVKTSNILSKYFGESSKLISALYAIAREKTPSIIFIDEFDAIAMSRGIETHDASHRMLSTLLSELDGFQDKKAEDFVLTLAATNFPWALDTAILSRFPIRLYVPLPDKESCKKIIKIHLQKFDLSKLDLLNLAERCVEKFYSGRDIENLCKHAVWKMIKEENPIFKSSIEELTNISYESIKKMKLKIRPLCLEDFNYAFDKIHSPLTKGDIERYEKWNKDFGGW